MKKGDRLNFRARNPLVCRETVQRKLLQSPFFMLLDNNIFCLTSAGIYNTIPGHQTACISFIPGNIQALWHGAMGRQKIILVSGFYELLFPKREKSADIF